MAYYDFLLNQWKLGNLTDAQIDSAVSKGYITTTEAETIKSTPRSG